MFAINILFGGPAKKGIYFATLKYPKILKLYPSFSTLDFVVCEPYVNVDYFSFSKGALSWLAK